MIQELFEDNEKNFSRTKDILKKLSEEEFGINEKIDYQNNQNLNNNENINNNNDMIIEENINGINKDNKNNIEKNNELKNKNNIDITHFAKFEVVDNNEFERLEKEKKIEKENDNLKGNNNTNDKFLLDLKDKNKNDNHKENNSTNYNFLLDLKDKNKKEYYSIFNEEPNNNSNISNNNYKLKDETVIDDYLFDQNIEFLCECFPDYNREQIIKKICDFNFDIDNVVQDILNETTIDFNQNDDDLVNSDITDKAQILSNFLSFEKGKEKEFNMELFQENLVQFEIEEMIKKENIKKKNNFNNEDNDIIIDSNQNNNNDKETEEFFLYKNIDEIKTPIIKEDLKKLIKHFPLEEEFNIKLVYYQYMDYNLTYHYFSNKDGSKIIGLKSLLDSKDNKNYSFNNGNKNYVKRYNNNKNKHSINKYNELEEQRQFEIFKKIIDNKPINWKFEKDYNVNLNDYIAVRKRLFMEAKNAYANKNFKNGQILMAKARRYHQEIDKIYKNQRINNFLHNYENIGGNEIDLHGLTVPESKFIIDKKLQTLKLKKIDNDLKKISMVIITGTGSHSAGHKSVLYPNLMEWLKNRDKLSVSGDLTKGLIFVTIY